MACRRPQGGPDASGGRRQPLYLPRASPTAYRNPGCCRADCGRRGGPGRRAGGAHAGVPRARAGCQNGRRARTGHLPGAGAVAASGRPRIRPACDAVRARAPRSRSGGAGRPADHRSGAGRGQFRRPGGRSRCRGRDASGRHSHRVRAGDSFGASRRCGVRGHGAGHARRAPSRLPCPAMPALGRAARRDLPRPAQLADAADTGAPAALGPPTRDGRWLGRVVVRRADGRGDTCCAAARSRRACRSAWSRGSRGRAVPARCAGRPRLRAGG